MQQPWIARQGDVILTTHVYNDQDELVPVEPPSESSVVVQRRDDRGVILQEGMVTGHAHHLPGSGAVLSRETDGTRKLEVVGVEPLEHDEHDTIEVPTGIVAVGIQVEHVPGELPRQVMD